MFASSESQEALALHGGDPKGRSPSGGIRDMFTTCCACHALSSEGGRGGALILNHQDQLDRQLLECVDCGDIAAVQRCLLDGASIEGPPARAVSSSTLPRGLRRPLLLDASKSCTCNLVASTGRNCTCDMKMTEMLLENLADANSTNQDGWTALFFAAQIGNVRLCKVLLEHAADPRKPDRVGLNALDYARDLEMRRELEKILHDRGIMAPRLKELAPAAGRTVQQSEKECRNFKGVVNARDRHGRTALHIAAESGNIDVVRKLLAREDFDGLNARDKQGRTALNVAVEKGHDQVVLVLSSALEL